MELTAVVVVEVIVVLLLAPYHVEEAVGK